MEDEKTPGEMVPNGSLEEVFNKLLERHIFEHSFYRNLYGEKAVESFRQDYFGFASRVYSGCFGKGKATFDGEKYSCGLSGVADKVFINLLNSEVFPPSNLRPEENTLEKELSFVKKYGFVAREIFCDACPENHSCGEYQKYLSNCGWRKYSPELDS